MKFPVYWELFSETVCLLVQLARPGCDAAEPPP